MSHLEKRINKLFTSARNIEVEAAYHQIDWAEWDVKDEKEPPPQYLLDKDEELTNVLRWNIQSLYQSVSAYLDEKGLHQYRQDFIKIFGSNPDEPEGINDFDIDHYWSGEPYNVFLRNLNRFLGVFEFYSVEKSDNDHQFGIKYLERVLRNTASIISQTKTVVNSETDVYKAVKPALTAMFPSAKSPKSNFIKSFKEYKPDILVPEVQAAVEYKYATTEAKLKDTIDQICADVKGYNGDGDYKIFYAVFYVTKDFWGDEKFKSVWDNMDFPDNWNAFYVVGA